MNQSYDAIVVGSGPAGTSAAYTLARQKASVLLIDKAVFPRPKLCGGLLTLKTTHAIECGFGLGLEDLRAAGAVDYSSMGYAIYFRNALINRGQGNIPFHFSDRRVLDDLLLRRAREAGAVTLLGERVTQCLAGEGVVRTASGRTFEGRMIIGADGVNSVARKCLPWTREEQLAWRRNLAATIEIKLDPTDVPRGPDYPVLYAGFVKYGYAWLFPNRDHYLAGICSLMRPGENLRAPFLEFLRFLGVPKAETIPLHGHPLPLGNFLKDPYHDRCLLAGDAAGIVETLLGEGIYYALTSGRMAAEALLAAEFAPEAAALHYKKALKRTLYRELTWSKYLRSFLYFILGKVHHLPIRFFVGGSRGRLFEMVHGVRSYRLFRRVNL